MKHFHRIALQTTTTKAWQTYNRILLVLTTTYSIAFKNIKSIVFKEYLILFWIMNFLFSIVFG